nr:uncharacterized protein CTRU02_04276 [Colletotrichum truncatum]KAF6796315.1 hypothetical protein CTRU02_04276 [Colletotrichum truncatum]
MVAHGDGGEEAMYVVAIDEGDNTGDAMPRAALTTATLQVGTTVDKLAYQKAEAPFWKSQNIFVVRSHCISAIPRGRTD